MKGRLLKGGEPDLNAVAKILLSDWVRGRIPYFVAPPERPGELNRTEAKLSNGKEKAAETRQDRVLGVTQNLGSIMQKNSFLDEDVQRIEELVDDKHDDEVGVDGGDGVDDDDGEEEEEGSSLSNNDNETETGDTSNSPTRQEPRDQQGKVSTLRQLLRPSDVPCRRFKRC
jgi:nuclear GTP-binding protein